MPPGRPDLPPISPGATALFCLRFAAIYLALSLLWPWVRPACESVFCGLAGAAFRLPSGLWEVEFDRTSGNAPPDRLRAVIVNPKLMNPDGSGPVRNVDIDIEAFGWRPMALLTALSLSVPFPRQRRFVSWAVAAIVLQASSILILGLVLWGEAVEIAIGPDPAIETALRGVALKLLPVGLPVLIWSASALFLAAKPGKLRHP